MALRLSRTAVSVFFRASVSCKQLLPASTHLISDSTTSANSTSAFNQSTLPFSSLSARFFSSRTRTFDPNIDEIGPDTILFEGCDYNHWLITIDFPKDQNLTREQMIEYYVNTAAQIFGRSCVCLAIDPVNKEYGGDKYINGEIIPRPPPVHYGRRSNNRDRRPREQMQHQQGNAPHNNQSQNYGPPPRQNYGPPSPQQNYGAPPQHNYGPPSQQNYGAPPQHNYGAPPQHNYGPPPPRQNYGYPPQPQQNYGPPPQQNYGLPQNRPPQPLENYGQPPNFQYQQSRNPASEGTNYESPQGGSFGQEGQRNSSSYGNN